MAVNKYLQILFLLFLMLSPAFLRAQNTIPLLERTITLTADGERLEAVLDEIAKQGRFSFSYNPLAIESGKSVNLRLNRKPVREALDILLGSGFKYKSKGNHIIITRSVQSPKSTPPSYFLISGYVTDGLSGEKIPEATIYDKRSLASSVTDDYGHYRLKIDRKINEIQLSVNKEKFKDTLIYIRQTGSLIVNVTIYPEPLNETPADTTPQFLARLKNDQLAFMNFILSEEQKVNTKNLKDTLHKKYQITFLPFAGTNLKLSGSATNDYSLNLLCGYSMGTRKAELGGLINIDRDSVRYVQLAGLINAVGGPVQGVQLGGLVNANMNTTSGIQMAGLINFSRDTMHAFQAGGLLNVNGGDMVGVSCAGLIGVSLGAARGVQVSGLVNAAIHSMEGVQVAGLVNVALKNITGTQVSGLVNYAGQVKGTQLGFINISDSCSGIPIGFLSFSRHGYHRIELGTDEVFPFNLTLRTGVKRFYNIFTSGIKTGDPEMPVWNFGYGLGTSVSLGRKWWMDFDITTQQIVKGETFEEMNLLSKFSVSVEKYVFKKIGIALGPVLNYYSSNTTVPYYASDFDKLAPYTFLNRTYSNHLNIKMWLGAKLALRIL